MSPANTLHLVAIAVAAWLIPGAGFLLQKRFKHAAIVMASVVIIFVVGIYVGSLAVVNFDGTAPFYVKGAQMMNSPVVFLISAYSAKNAMTVYGWPCEVGQIYTSTAGWLTLLAMVQAVYWAYLEKNQIDYELENKE